MNVEPDDDQHWLDLLAGRTAADADARTRKEAAWMRAALLSYRMTAPTGAPADADARAARLLARARQAGVLGAAANEPRLAAGLPALQRHRRRWPQALAAGLAACAVAVTLLPLRPGTEADEAALRGAAVQTFTASDAAQRRQRLLQDLRDAGFDAQPYERLDRLGIDVDVPVPLPGTQAAALKRLGLAAPAGPSLQIEFIPAPSPTR